MPTHSRDTRIIDEGSCAPTPPRGIRSRGIPLWVPIALSAGPVVALGFARFAYALLLPAMRSALGWSYATAGAMNTANALGYILGAMVAAPLAKHMGGGRTFLWCVTVTAMALLATGSTGNTVVLALLRIISGAAGGIAFVVGGGLVAQASVSDIPRRATLLLGIYFGGAGLGVVLSGLTVPLLLASTNQTVGWRLPLAIHGGVGLLMMGGVIPAIRHTSRTQSIPTQRPNEGWPVLRLWPTLVSYGLYGAGYIAYMTFNVAFLKNTGSSSHEITLFWVVLGSAAMASAFLWSRLLEHAPGDSVLPVS